MVGIGFFAPLPLAMMMPFMAGQSMLMGDAFGKAYQYGKRKISAMSNEEFNALTPEMLGQQIVTDYKGIIPSLEEAVKASTEFQSIIIQEMGIILKSIPNELLKFFGIEPPTEEAGLLFVTLDIVKAWLDSKLVTERTINLTKYNLSSQAIIIAQYNLRIPPEPEPVPEPEPAPLPTGLIDLQVFTQVHIGAVGRVASVSGFWEVQSNILSEYTLINDSAKFSSVEDALNFAINAWPLSPYTMAPHKGWIYFVQSSKATNQ